MQTALKRVVAVDPFDGAAHSTLGRLALSGGDTAEAVRLFRVALAAKPLDKAGAHADLAEALLKAGQRDEARKQVHGSAADRADLHPGAGPAAEAARREAASAADRRAGCSSPTLIVGLAWLAGEIGGANPGRRRQQVRRTEVDVRRASSTARSTTKAAPASRLAYWDEPWAIDAPAAEQNLSRRIKSVTAIDVGEPIVLTLEDPKLWENPWIYIVEPSNLVLKDTEVPILREFLLRGGTLTFDDFHGPYEWELTREAAEARVSRSRDRRDCAAASDLHVLLSHRQVSADSRPRFVPERPHLGEGRLHRASARHPRRQGPADGADQLEHRHGRRRRVVERAGVSRAT